MASLRHNDITKCIVKRRARWTRSVTSRRDYKFARTAARGSSRVM